VLKVGALSINFPVFNTSKPTTPKYKDISRIIDFSKTLDSIGTKNIAQKKIGDNSVTKDTVVTETTPFNTDSLKCLLRPLEYPEGNDTLLYSFFRELERLPSDNKLIHILHYGDSQIEGDRITSYLRSQMQKRFGGEGIGLFPVVAVNPSAVPYNYEISDNWIRYSPQDLIQKEIHNKYGALISYSRIEPKSGLFKKNDIIEGWINLKQPNSSSINTQNFSKCQIFYGTNASPLMVELKQNDNLIDADIIPPSDKLNVLNWNFTKPERNLVINFKTNQSPDFYAISLTGTKGVMVDNIPLRGSSGLEFSRSNRYFLGEFYKLLNVKLILLQFGVNIVPNVTSNYNYYERSFSKQLEFLKNANPDLSIIVIGLSDVARNTTNGMESYPNIEKIRNAQKAAAFAQGCAFWDMFEAMGGKNSMPSWVNATPPLAQKDFIHLNPAGARIIGELFYRSLLNDFEQFVKTKQTTL
jgi:lysophospholipase L1-like esterase